MYAATQCCKFVVAVFALVVNEIKLFSATKVGSIYNISTTRETSIHKKAKRLMHFNCFAINTRFWFHSYSGQHFVLSGRNEMETVMMCNTAVK
ncbi:hypothetical protein CVS40_4424 [Lucilia cuprina]|nr:hypothetical protein CVS40_4424 [Lucilia cuprina]